MPWSALWSGKKKDEPKAIDERVNEAVDSAVENVTSAADSLKDGKGLSTSSAFLKAFTQPQTLLATVLLTGASLSFFRFYRTYLRRIPEAVNIKPTYFQKRSIFGKVTSVGDGDNFRIYHTPGGWLAGWGWLPWRRVPTDRKVLKNKTVRWYLIPSLT
jgi:hypothetical protein